MRIGRPPASRAPTDTSSVRPRLRLFVPSHVRSTGRPENHLFGEPDSPAGTTRGRPVARRGGCGDASGNSHYGRAPPGHAGGRGPGRGGPATHGGTSPADTIVPNPRRLCN